MRKLSEDRNTNMHQKRVVYEVRTNELDWNLPHHVGHTSCDRPHMGLRVIEQHRQYRLAYVWLLAEGELFVHSALIER